MPERSTIRSTALSSDLPVLLQRHNTAAWQPIENNAKLSSGVPERSTIQPTVLSSNVLILPKSHSKPFQNTKDTELCSGWTLDNTIDSVQFGHIYVHSESQHCCQSDRQFNRTCSVRTYLSSLGINRTHYNHDITEATVLHSRVGRYDLNHM